MLQGIKQILVVGDQEGTGFWAGCSTFVPWVFSSLLYCRWDTGRNRQLQLGSFLVTLDDLISISNSVPSEAGIQQQRLMS